MQVFLFTYILVSAILKLIINCIVWFFKGLWYAICFIVTIIGMIVGKNEQSHTPPNM